MDIQDLSHEYTCPNCDSPIIVPYKCEKFYCKDCRASGFVNYDAEFKDGMWHDLTKLYITNKPL